jgi:hypothetical protein
MKKLAIVAVLFLSIIGCRSHCTNATIFSAGEKGCRDRCIESPTLTCDCNSGCPCHEHKKWQEEKRAASAKKEEQKN